MIGSWDFLQNPHLALNSSLFWSLLCLALLAGCGVGFSIVKEYARKRRKDVFWTPKERLIASVSTIAERLGMVMIGAILGTFGGIGIRDHQLSKNTFEYDGVSVLSQQSDKRYGLLIPGYSKQWDFEFCHDIKMPAPLIDIKYEQRNGCKQVYGVGFVRISKENSNAQLQTGRNSPASTEASLW